MIVAIPAITGNKGELLHAQLSLLDSTEGATYLNNIESVSDVNKASIVNIKKAAEWLAGKRFEQDVKVVILERRQDITGRSWELALVMGLTSLLTGIPLNPGVTGSGIVGQYGSVLPVTSLSQKIAAAKQAGFKRFLVSSEQLVEPTEGIDIRPVSDIVEAWTRASNGLPCQQTRRCIY